MSIFCKWAASLFHDDDSKEGYKEEQSSVFCGKCKCNPCDCSTFDMTNFDDHVELFKTKSKNYRYRVRGHDGTVAMDTKTYKDPSMAAQDLIESAMMLGVSDEKHLEELKKRLHDLA